MKIKYAVLGMLFAFGVGIGTTADASHAMYECCMAKQALCEDNAANMGYPPGRCDGVYERCMLSNSCQTGY